MSLNVRERMTKFRYIQRTWKKLDRFVRNGRTKGWSETTVLRNTQLSEQAEAFHRIQVFRDGVSVVLYSDREYFKGAFKDMYIAQGIKILPSANAALRFFSIQIDQPLNLFPRANFQVIIKLFFGVQQYGLWSFLFKTSFTMVFPILNVFFYGTYRRYRKI